MKKGVIFDLDGTLIDSLEDIAINSNIMLKTLGYPTHQLDNYKHFVGDGAKILVQNALPQDISPDKLDEALELFIKLYEKKLHKNTKLYDGVAELLLELTTLEIKLAILSNKPHKYTNIYVDTLIKNIPFVDVVGQKEKVAKKPDPIAAFDIASKFKLETHNIYFVGDTATDMKTAKNANMIAIGVAWGFRSVEELVENGADHIINHPLDLLKIVS